MFCQVRCTRLVISNCGDNRATFPSANQRDSGIPSSRSLYISVNHNSQLNLQAHCTRVSITSIMRKHPTNMFYYTPSL